MGKIEDLKEEVRSTGIKLIENNLVAGTWGNISARIDDKYMVITPSGVDYKIATSDDMVIVNIHDLTYDHPLKPSSEVKLHSQIYKVRSDVGAVIHIHSMSVSTIAATRREIPPILDDMVQILGPSIKIAKYALPSTKKLVKETMKALKGRNAAILANHGGIALGRDINEAFTAAMILEKTCRVFIESEFLGGAKSINRFEARLMHEYYKRKYSKQGKK